MPTANSLKDVTKTVSSRALFVVLVMLLNISLSTLSSVSAYAQVVEDKGAVTEETVETEEKESEESNTEKTQIVNEEQAEETEMESDKESVEETTVVTDEVEETVVLEEEEVVKVTELEEVVEVIDLLNVSLDCQTRTGLQEYSFQIFVEAEDDVTYPVGEPTNLTDPESYSDIVPTEFSSGKEVLVVEGWDGAAFTWMIEGQEVQISLEAEKCDSPTIADRIAENENTEVLDAVLASLAESKQCRAVFALGDNEFGQDLTVFAPQNSAFGALVSAPADVTNELNQLTGNPDELCALIVSHVVVGEYTSDDVTQEGATLNAFGNDQDGIFVQKIGGNVYVDGSLVIEANLFASNGIVHIVSDVLLPQAAGTINGLVTDQTSPALSGNIMLPVMSAADDYDMTYELCVLVRVDGIPYVADVTGTTWSIDEGVVSLNPTKTDTLFDVVVRSGYGYYSDVESNQMGCEVTDDVVPEGAAFRANLVAVSTHGAGLVGLTMRDDVISYLEPEIEEEPAGEVLGEVDEPVVVAVVETDETVVVAGTTNGKGGFGDVAQSDDSEVDSDGDGVPDSEDPAPNDPNITGLEVEDTDDSDSTEQAENDDNENVALWFIAGGGVVLIWYLLWQRSGREA